MLRTGLCPPSKFLCWSPNPKYFTMQLYLQIGSLKREGKVGSLEWTLAWVTSNMTSVFIKRGEWDTQAHRLKTTSAHGKVRVTFNSKRHQKIPTLLTSGSQTPGLQNCNNINVCSLSLPVCGTLLRQPWKTTTLTIIWEIIPQNEKFFKCFKFFSNLNTYKDILFTMEKIKVLFGEDTTWNGINKWSFHTGLLTEGVKRGTKKLNLDLFIFYFWYKISILKF